MARCFTYQMAVRFRNRIGGGMAIGLIPIRQLKRRAMGPRNKSGEDGKMGAACASGRKPEEGKKKRLSAYHPS
jgi:hypothetical protein